MEKISRTPTKYDVFRETIWYNIGILAQPERKTKDRGRGTKHEKDSESGGNLPVYAGVGWHAAHNDGHGGAGGSDGHGGDSVGERRAGDKCKLVCRCDGVLWAV